ncbi:MAG: C-terminal binding protein [Pseudomonadota bacterium]|nr:C-terminal binding protein [Pseudomonadota bacterium]
MVTPIVAVVDTVFPNLSAAEEALKRVNAEIVIAEKPTPEKILAVAADADAVLVTYGQITSEVIKGLNNCKVIGRFGIGIDNIDLNAADAKGITVTYAPTYCLDEVSDHTMALLLSLARKIPFANNMVSSGRWEMPAVVPVKRIRGMVLGLIGFGNIPRQIVGKAKAFGINVVASDPYCPDDIFKEYGVERVDFEELLAISDYVSVHAPLTADTENMLDSAAFNKMKKTALLINTARGPLVNTEDLALALDQGKIAGAGLDVLPSEPPKENDPLIGRDNVVLTPHTGFYSEDALNELQSTVAADVAAVLAGEQPRFPVSLG